MYTPSTLPLFPACPRFGFSSQPMYLVKKAEREGGYERRDLKWEEPLHYYEGVAIGPKAQRNIETVMKFWHALTGEFVRFRFKDWNEYQSCDLDDDPAATDQPIQVTSGSPGGYQLTKQYVIGSFVTIRTIQCPKGDSIRIANGSGVEQPASSWTIDEDTGILTVTGGFSGVPTSWGGEFYVPVRFDGALNIVGENHKIKSCTVNLKELRRDP